MMKKLVLIAHDLRSAHNVGSLIRTADCLGVTKVILSGHSPYPSMGKADSRLPHVIKRAENQIAKTSLGSEDNIELAFSQNINDAISELKQDGYTVVALEQSEDSIKLGDYRPNSKTALIVGNEPNGIDADTLKNVDDIVEIPMLGKKESLNVVQAAAIALYVLQEA